MRRRLLPVVIIVTLLASAAVAASMLGVASGEGPVGSTASRSVSVQGVGVVPIGAEDTAAQATAVYREGIAKALADGQAKAAFIAEKAGGALGAAVSIVEDGGYIECSSPGSGYASYEGEQPDFGYGRTPVTAAAPEGLATSKGTSSAPSVSHRPKVKRRHRAKKATAAHCNLTANVSVVYGLG